MNPDDPSEPHLTPAGDAELEARIVAWVLGEASASEMEELEKLCEARPELRAFQQQIRAVHELVAQDGELLPVGEWSLPEEKRAKVTALFDEGGQAEVARLSRAGRYLRPLGLLASAACLTVGVGTWFSTASREPENPRAVVREREAVRQEKLAKVNAERRQELKQAIAAQEVIVEQKREALQEIIRTQEKSPFSDAQTADMAARTIEETRTSRATLIAQLGALRNIEGDPAIEYASGLDLPDNLVKTLYPQYLEQRRTLDRMKAEGLGEKNPQVIAQKQVIDEAKGDLDRSVVTLRGVLGAKLALADESLKRMTNRRDSTHASAVSSSGEVSLQDARGELRVQTAMLDQLKSEMAENEPAVASAVPASPPAAAAPSMAIAGRGIQYDDKSAPGQARMKAERPEMGRSQEALADLSEAPADPAMEPPMGSVFGANSASGGAKDLAVAAKGAADQDVRRNTELNMALGNTQLQPDGSSAPELPYALAPKLRFSSRGYVQYGESEGGADLAAGQSGFKLGEEMPKLSSGSENWNFYGGFRDGASEPDPEKLGLPLAWVTGAVNADSNSLFYGFRQQPAQGTEFFDRLSGAADTTNIVDPVPTLKPLQVPPLELVQPEPEPVLKEISAAEESASTFSLHVSDVSFRLAKAAVDRGERPAPESIREEEFYNAVNYGDPLAGKEAVACVVESAAHPIRPQRDLLRIGVRTGSSGRSQQTPLNLVLLLDSSGSMERDDRRSSLVEAVRELSTLLKAGDTVSVVGFSRQPKLLVDRLPGQEAAKLNGIVANSPVEGGTDLAQGLKLAGDLAARQFQPQAQNRIVLFTDGAANLGDADPESLAGLITSFRKQHIAFDAAGFGAEGLNDKLLEQMTRSGDGRYYVVNRAEDAGEHFAKQLAGAFRPAAQDVKVQVIFNPARVGKYRLAGFAEHRLKKEDFRNDAVDAAEMAAEEAGNALYEVETLAAGEGEIGEVRVRFRDAATGEMIERSWTIPYRSTTPAFDQAPASLQLAGLALLCAEKLKGGAPADAIDFTSLAGSVAAVKQAYGDSSSVQQLLEMIGKLR